LVPPDLSPVVDIESHRGAARFTDPMDLLVAYRSQVARKP
jgi:hypothetical protein